MVQNSKVQVQLRSPPREAKKANTQPLSRTLTLARCTQRKAPSSSHQPVWHSIWRYPTKRLRCQSNPGGWSCVVSGRSYVIAGSFVVSGCCASVLILVLDAGYDMHTYGAFSHKMRLAAKCAPLLLYFSKISEYLTVAEIRILMVGRVCTYPEGWSCVLKYRNISRAAEIRILGVGRVHSEIRVCTRARVGVWALRRVACTDLTSSGYNGNQ